MLKQVDETANHNDRMLAAAGYPAHVGFAGMGTEPRNWQWLLKVSFFRQFIKLMDIKAPWLIVEPGFVSTKKMHLMGCPAF